MTIDKLFRGCLFVIFLAVFLSSCKSTRQATGEQSVSVTSWKDYWKSVLDRAPAFDSFSSKVRFTVQLDGKDLTVNGSIKMKKNEIIQLSVAPFLGIEVARAEITPESILIIDRMNKRYVQAPVSLLRNLGDTDLDFYSLQAMFFNELFMPGVHTIGMKDYAAFDFAGGANGTTSISLKKPGNALIRFVTSTAESRLTSCRITSADGFLFEWLYAGFQPFAGKMFPSLMEISLQDPKRKASLVMEFSRMSRGKDEAIRTGIPKKYQRVDVEDLIKQLMK